MSLIGTNVVPPGTLPPTGAASSRVNSGRSIIGGQEEP